MLYLRVGEHLIDRIERPARHANFVHQLDPIGARPPLGDLGDLLVERLAVLRARRSVGVIRVAQQVLRVGRLTEPLPQIVARGGNVDLPVGGRE